MALRIRLVWDRGNKIVSFDDSALIKDLLAKIKEEIPDVDVGPKTLRVKAGVPPAAVDIESLGARLVESGIKSGERVIIEASTDSAVKSTNHSKLGEAEKTPNSQRLGTSNSVELRPTRLAPDGSPLLYILSPQGALILRQVPSDNSCLFHAISQAYFRTREQSQYLREIVGSTISSNPAEYNAAILGKPVEEYAKWIVQKTSWGGDVELSILSLFLGVSIYALDVENKRFVRFNDFPAVNGTQQSLMILSYSGIHYDLIAFNEDFSSSDNVDKDITVFTKGSELADLVVKELTMKLHNKLLEARYVTNTNVIKIMCTICQNHFTGEIEASQHASETGHMSFRESE